MSSKNANFANMNDEEEFKIDDDIKMNSRKNSYKKICEELHKEGKSNPPMKKALSQLPDISNPAQNNLTPLQRVPTAVLSTRVNVDEASNYSKTDVIDVVNLETICVVDDAITR